jgi:uncharacterized lipoprotein YajG
MNKKICVIGLFLIMLSGCAYMPHDVTIDPKLPVESRDIGHNKTLKVSVVDGRPREIIGHRSYMRTGKISLAKKQELANDIKIAIEKGFNTYGFTIVQSGTVDRFVDVNIRLIEFESTYGFFTLGSFSRGSFEVTCTVPSGKQFKNTYRVEHEHRTVFGTFASKNSEWINQAVSDALMRMFDDHDFLTFLENGK